MDDDYLFKAEEIVTRCVFNPDLKDVYVEGIDDISLIEILQEAGLLLDVVVYPVGVVSIENSAPYEDNNRGRVIKLADMISSDSEWMPGNVACIVDKDFEVKKGSDPDLGLLFHTDYCCSESYLISRKKLLLLVGRCQKSKDADPLSVVGWIEETTKFLFATRFVNWDSGLGLQQVDFSKDFSYSSGSFSFDSERYLDRYLNSSGQLKILKDFTENVRSQKVSDLDLNNAMNGHDFLIIMKFVLNKLNRPCSQLQKESAVTFILKVLCEPKDLSMEPMFAQLVEYFKAGGEV